MKKYSTFLASLIAGFAMATAQAQPGQAGPDFSGAMAKLFGNNKEFSAAMEIHAQRGGSGEIIMPGKLAFLDGKARFDMDLTQMKGGQMNPQVAERIKQMGMGTVATISEPGKKSLMIYPDMKAYVEIPTGKAGGSADTDYKTQTTKLGEEKLDGHDCVKNKMVVTGSDGVPHESTLWNARDLKDFPVKIESAERGANVVMVFKDVKLGKPDAAQFGPPSGFTKYDDMTSLMMSRVPKGPQQ